MYFYLVEKIGDGTEENWFRPNVPNGVSYVCTDVGNRFLVGTNDVLLETLVANLQSFCEDNGLNYSDVSKWFVGDSL